MEKLYNIQIIRDGKETMNGTHLLHHYIVFHFIDGQFIRALCTSRENLVKKRVYMIYLMLFGECKDENLYIIKEKY